MTTEQRLQQVSENQALILGELAKKGEMTYFEIFKLCEEQGYGEYMVLGLSLVRLQKDGKIYKAKTLDGRETTYTIIQ